jgi:hypothetical protein
LSRLQERQASNDVIHHAIVEDEVVGAIETQVQTGIGVSGHIVEFDGILGTIGEHVEPVHVPLQDIASYGIIAAGREEVYAVSAISVGHIIRDEVVVRVGEIYSVPTLAAQSVKAGIISRDGIAVGEDKGNSGLSTMDDGVVGNSTTRNAIELYPIKPVPNDEAGYTNIVRLYIYAGIPISCPDNRTVTCQVKALFYGYFVVSSRRYLESIARGGRIYRSLQI